MKNSWFALAAWVTPVSRRAGGYNKVVSKRKKEIEKGRRKEGRGVDKKGR